MKPRRRRLASRPDEALQYAAQVESPVELILHLPEIAMDVLVEAERVIRTGQRRLQIAQGRVAGASSPVLVYP